MFVKRRWVDSVVEGPVFSPVLRSDLSGSVERISRTNKEQRAFGGVDF